MVGGSTNIYVSVTEAVGNEHEQRYRRPQHIWMISVESHHAHIPGTSHKPQEPTHYAASTNSDSGITTIHQRPVTSEPPIMGNILVAEASNARPDDVRQVLEDEIGPSSMLELPKNLDQEPEAWIRKALHGLQKRKIAEQFDLDEFMTFANGYMAERRDFEAPALMAYPKLHKEHAKKSSKHRFWISHPMTSHTRTNRNGEASRYGGLM